MAEAKQLFRDGERERERESEGDALLCECVHLCKGVVNMYMGPNGANRLQTHSNRLPHLAQRKPRQALLHLTA